MSVLKKSKASLSLQDIRELGGTKDDLALLEGVDSDSASELEFNSDAEDEEGGAVTTNEIQSFIQSLGLDNVPPVKGAQESSSAPAENKKMKNETVKGRKEAKTTTLDEGAEPLDEVDKKIRKKGERKEAATNEASVSGGSGEPQIDDGVNRQLRHLSVKLYKKMLVSMDSEEMWYDQAQSSGLAFPVSADVIEHLLQVGEGLMKNELQIYEQVRQKRKGASEVRWLKTVLSSGTLSDKMAALTLLVQESPVHTLSSLDSLLSMASKKGKRECILAVDTLKELWITDLLPEGRKLKTLKQRPLNQLLPDGSHSLQQCHHTLLLWYYEHQLKNRYAQFLTILKGLSHDTVANVREKMVGHIFDLLYQRPEQEQELLSQLINKIGDPVKKIASKVILFVLKLLSHHVNMKVIVAMAIERLLHRPNIGQRAQYYAICCLNQFTIGQDDEALAAKLVELFFTFFKLYVKKGQLDAKMLGALLTGVNRAFPFLKGDIPSFEEHLHSLFTVVHVGPLATGIQSLMLLFQVMESRSSVSGRYYQALYTKLMDPALKHSGKQAMFLNLLFKSVKSDPEINRVKAFLKRILQICSAHSPPFICGCLFLISEIVKHKPSLWSFILQSETSDEEHFTDVGTATLTSFDDGTQTQDGDPKEEGHVTMPGVHMTQRGVGYRVAYRNPLYCGAEHTCLWELSQLTKHYHPSVQVFAKKIASGEHIDYRGDPLADFTLMRFLDRFICKNPKQKQSDHGGSVMQRTTKMATDPSSKILANSSQFASMDESKIRVDEVFMHRYFTQKAANEKKKKTRKREKEEGERRGDMDTDRFSAESQSDSDMDFAGELERQAKSNRKLSKKARRKVEGSSDDEESGGDVESIDDGLDYDALMMSDDDSLIGGGAGGEGATAAEPTDAEMERLLLDNLSSGSEVEIDGSDQEEEKGPPRKKRKNKEQFEQGGKFDTRSLFAAADEFAHLLEDSSGGHGGRGDVRRKDRATEKQLEWEERRAVPQRFSKRGGRYGHHRNRNKKKGQSTNKPSGGSGKNSQGRLQPQSKLGARRTGRRSSRGNRQQRGRAKRESRRK